MEMKQNPKNWGVLVGIVMSIEHSHYNAQHRPWYKVTLRVNRKTEGKYDDLPILVPGWLITEKNVECGKIVKVEGEVRSYTNHDGGWQKRQIMLYTRYLQVMPDDSEHQNQVRLEGNIYRVLEKRITPVSNRRLIIFSLNVMRDVEPYWHDGIYCIAWGKGADMIETLGSGANVKIEGRMNARNFNRRHIQEVTYEISVVTIE